MSILCNASPVDSAIPVSEERAIGLEHLPGLYSYAMVLTRNPADAEDLVQETYVRALRAIGTVWSISDLKPWLFTILRNLWLNTLRAKRRRPTLLAIDCEDRAHDVSAESALDPDDIYSSGVERQLVQGAIQKLPSEYREVIVLREYQELSYREIADVLQCPMGTVMSRLGRARSRLRRLLADVWQDR